MWGLNRANSPNHGGGDVAHARRGCSSVKSCGCKKPVSIETPYINYNANPRTRSAGVQRILARGASCTPQNRQFKGIKPLTAVEITNTL